MFQACWIQNHAANAGRETGNTGSPGIQTPHLGFTRVTSFFDGQSYSQAHNPSTSIFSSRSNCQGLCVSPPFLHSHPAWQTWNYCHIQGKGLVIVHFSTHMSFNQRMEDFHSWERVCMQESDVISWVS